MEQCADVRVAASVCFSAGAVFCAWAFELNVCQGVARVSTAWTCASLCVFELVCMYLQVVCGKGEAEPSNPKIGSAAGHLRPVCVSKLWVSAQFDFSQNPSCSLSLNCYTASRNRPQITAALLKVRWLLIL